MKNPLYILLLFPIFLSAQKSVQVESYLGLNRYTNESPSGTVYFRFDKITLQRQGDGRKTYRQLLKDVTGYSDSDNAGDLKSIQIRRGSGVEIVPKAGGAEGVGFVESSSGDPVRPRGVLAVDSSYGEAWSLPDSATMAVKLDGVKKRVGFYSSQAWATIRPVWSFFMFAFWLIFPLLGVASVVLWFWAKLSANEEMPDLHRFASRWLLLIVAGTWTVFLVNGFMTLIYWELSPGALIFCLFVLGFIAFTSAAWIIPNFRQRHGGRIQAQRVDNFNQRRIDG